MALFAQRLLDAPRYPMANGPYLSGGLGSLSPPARRRNRCKLRESASHYQLIVALMRTKLKGAPVYVRRVHSDVRKLP